MLPGCCLFLRQLRWSSLLLFWRLWGRLLRSPTLTSPLIIYPSLVMLTHYGVRLTSRSRRPWLAFSQPLTKISSGWPGCRMLLTLPRCFSKGVWKFWKRTDYDTKRQCKRLCSWRQRSPSGGLLLELCGELSALRWSMPLLHLLRP